MEAAALLCETRGVASEQAESHAVEASECAQIEYDAGEPALGVIKRGVEGLFIVAIDDAACALDDVDAADVAVAERK